MLSSERRIEAFNDRLRSSTDLALSPPTIGRPVYSRRPSCTNTDAWSQYSARAPACRRQIELFTSPTSTRFPVGARPGSIQSIEMVWVNRPTISSTTRPWPMVRDTETNSYPVGSGAKVFGIKLVDLFSSVAANHLVDEWVETIVAIA